MSSHRTEHLSRGPIRAGEAVVLTIKRCREILGAGCKLTDEELEALRNQLYGVAEVALKAFASEAEPGGDEAEGC